MWKGEGLADYRSGVHRVYPLEMWWIPASRFDMLHAITELFAQLYAIKVALIQYCGRHLCLLRSECGNHYDMNKTWHVASGATGTKTDAIDL